MKKNKLLKVFGLFSILMLTTGSLVSCGEGEKGETGEQGEKGDTGATGDKGDTGATGDQGEKGDTGATGATGDKGDKGDTGSSGSSGAKGETTYSSTILPSDNGYVTVDKGGEVIGGAIKFTFHPDTGYTLKTVKINGVEKYDGVTGDDKVKLVDSEFVYSTTMVKNGFVVQAEFKVMP